MEAAIASRWEELKSAAAERGIALFQGMPLLIGPRGQQGSFRTATWTGDVVGFLDVAKAAGIVLAYTEYDVLDYRGRLVEVVRDEAPLFDPDDKTTDQDKSALWLYERLRERTSKHEQRDGKPCSVQCVWVKEGIHHRFGSRADWYEDFLVTLADVADEAERIDRENRLMLDAAESKRINDLAEQLALHPRYAEANSDAKRRYVAEQLFPNEEEIGAIVSLADMIYWWDVEPRERATAAKKVRDLYDSGMTQIAISGVLNLSIDKVRKLLAQTEPPR